MNKCLDCYRTVPNDEMTTILSENGKVTRAVCKPCAKKIRARRKAHVAKLK